MTKFGLLHQEISVTPFTLGIMHRGFHQHLHDKYLNIHFKNSFIAYKNYQVDWYGDLDNFSDLADRVIDLSIKNNFSSKLLSDTKKIGEKIFIENNHIESLDLKNISNIELGQELQKLYLLGNKISDLGQMAVFPDLRFYKLSTILKNLIKEKKIRQGLKMAPNEYFSLLVASSKSSLSAAEKKELLTLALTFDKNRKLKDLFKKESPGSLVLLLEKEYKNEYRKISKLNKKYRWLIFGQLGPTKQLIETVEELKDLLKKGSLKSELNELQKEKQNFLDKQKKYTKELCLDAGEKKLFEVARDFSFNKIYRYEMLMFNFYNLDRILHEVSFRTKYTVKQLQFMSHEEIVGLLQGNKTISKDEIKKRQHFCVTIIKSNNNIEFLTGDMAKLYIKNNTQAESVKDDIMVVHGSVAFMGRVFGKVKIVNSRDDMDKVEVGDVLVSIQTNPDLLPAMKKASALVTDVGGITSHAAIVARELRKPCIIGTKIATKIFKDGDMVEVDATKGDVKKISS